MPRRKATTVRAISPRSARAFRRTSSAAPESNTSSGSECSTELAQGTTRPARLRGNVLGHRASLAEARQRTPAPIPIGTHVELAVGDLGDAVGIATIES